MTIRLEILDGATPLLEQIYLMSREAALEVLSKSGNYIRKAERNAMTSFYHQWQNEMVNGKRRVWKSREASRVLGARTAISSARSYVTPKTANMSAFITSYLDEKNLLVVVGGRHKQVRQSIRRDGEVVGSTTLYGVSRSTHGILEKLALGRRTADYKRYSRPGSWPNFANASYVARDFVTPGIAAAGAEIAVATDRMAKLIGKQVARVEIKRRKVSA